MHRGCFVWTPPPALAGRRTPRAVLARVCVCSFFLAGSGGPASWVRFGAPRLSFGRFFFLLCMDPSRLVLPRCCSFVCLLSSCLVPFARLCRLSLSLVSGPGCPGPGRFVSLSSLLFFFRAPVVSGVLWFPAPGALGLGTVRCLFCWSPASRLFVRSRCACVFRLAVGCSLVVAAPPPPLVSRGFRPCSSVPPPFFFPLLLCSCPLAWRLSAVLAVRCSPPPPLVCFVGLPLLGPRFAFGAVVFPAWPSAVSWWLLPPPPFVARGFRHCCPVPPPFFFSFLRCFALALLLGARQQFSASASPLVLVSSCSPAARLSVRSRCFSGSRCSAVLLFLSALPCAVLCCVSLGAVLCRAAGLCAARCCAVVCCVVLLRSFGGAPCCAVLPGAAHRPGALRCAAVRFAVSPHAVCSVLCVFCCGVRVRAVFRRCALCCVYPGMLC